MGFFNDLSKKTSEATNKITRETKLKLKVNENKGKIKNLYEEIGKNAYEAYLREENINIKDIIKEDCDKIDELSKEIEAARKEILELNHKKICNKCFAEIESEMQFCPKCGEKQNDDKTVLEKAEEKVEKTEISPESQKEAEDVKEKLKDKNSEE